MGATALCTSCHYGDHLCKITLTAIKYIVWKLSKIEKYDFVGQGHITVIVILNITQHVGLVINVGLSKY